MATRIKLRRGTNLQWASANPVLSLGEFGYETNTKRFKIGDGTTAWNSLPYNEQTITLSGDVSGTATGYDLNVEVTVHDDSHNHTTATLPNFTEDVQDVAGTMVAGGIQDGLVVEYDDVTGTINFNVNDPVITLSGDVSGSATIVNLSDTEIEVTINPDSVALGTDTTGDYVQTITGTENQVIVEGEGTESRDVTLSLPQDIHSGATPSFVGIELPNSKIVTDIVTVILDDTLTTLDTFSVSDYSVSEYIIQMKQGTKTTSQRIMVMWDGTDVHFNEYSIIDSTAGAVDATFDVSESGGMITVSASAPDASVNNITIKANTTYIRS